jgi:8-oxo-dGTP pyrophosphatase MutT (NUDIX family)
LNTDSLSRFATPEALVATAAQLALHQYLATFPEERGALAHAVSQFSEGGADILLRSTMAGHVTTSALVYDPEYDKVLLIAHGLYLAWMPPGGHFEFPGSLWDSAAREVFEETGAVAKVWMWKQGVVLPLDIDTHPIPAQPAKNEGPHFHHDFTYLATASSLLPLKLQEEEVDGAEWVSRAELSRSPLARVQRLGRKLDLVRANLLQ